MLGIFERIDTLAKERKVSYKTLAEYLGFSSAQTLTNLKYNDSMPKADVAIRIAHFFGVSVEYLVYGETEPQENLTAEYRELLRKHENMKKSIRDIIDKE